MTSTVYRDLGGTSTVKFGTAVYREYRPSLVAAISVGDWWDERQRREDRRRRGSRVWCGVAPSQLEEGSEKGTVPSPEHFSIFELKKAIFVHSGCYFCS